MSTALKAAQRSDPLAKEKLHGEDTVFSLSVLSPLLPSPSSM